MANYSERDLLIAEKMGALTSVVEVMQKNNDEAHRQTIKLIEGYCDENTRQHERFWTKISSHSAWINRIKGSLALIGIIFGTFGLWLKSKLGH